MESSTSHRTFLDDLAAARSGDVEAQGRLLLSCQGWLAAAASRRLGSDLASKASTSDLVQETLLGAHLTFDRFEGATRDELLAWLQTILQYRVANVARQYRETQKRRLDRELPAGSPMEGEFERMLVSGSTTPARRAAARESEAAICAALERLATDYRNAVIWRQYDGLTFEEIGQRLGRTAEASRKLWSRALIQLAAELGAGHEP